MLTISYYRNAEDAEKQVVTTENVIELNSCYVNGNQYIFFTRPSGEKITINFTMYLSAHAGDIPVAIILQQVISQSAYTEGDNYAAAADATEIIGVYTNANDAKAELSQLEKLRIETHQIPEDFNESDVDEINSPIFDGLFWDSDEDVYWYEVKFFILNQSGHPTGAVRNETCDTAKATVPGLHLVSVVKDIHEDAPGVEIAGLFSSEAKANEAKAKVQNWLEEEEHEDYAIFVAPVEIDALKWYDINESV